MRKIVRYEAKGSRLVQYLRVQIRQLLSHNQDDHSMRRAPCVVSCA